MDERLESTWKALADPTRREILDLLRAGPRTTGELAASFPDLTRFGVMKHLGVLEEASLVVTKKEGRKKWNHLNAVPLRRIYERWVSKYEDQWAAPLVNLKRRVESAKTERSDESHKEKTVSSKTLDAPPRTAIINLSIDIDSDRETVFSTFLEEPHDWFYESEESRKTKKTILEPKLGGRFYIRTETSGDENLIATVTMIKPNRELRMRGDCTIPNAFIANMTVKFTDEGAGTRVAIEHRMMGEFDDELPAGFDEGWLDGLQKLKTLVEGR